MDSLFQGSMFFELTLEPPEEITKLAQLMKRLAGKGMIGQRLEHQDAWQSAQEQGCRCQINPSPLRYSSLDASMNKVRAFDEQYRPELIE